MHHFNILVVAPYEGLKEVVRAVSKTHKNITVDILVANLRNKDVIIERISQNNFDAVISRGGLVEFIKTINPKPTIEIELTAFDMFRVLKLIEGYKGKKVLAAYHNIVESAKTVKELIKTDIDIFEMHRYDYNLTEQNVDQMVKDGYSVIIGDTGTWESAKNKGIMSVLMTSGKEGFQDALKKAIEICEYISIEQRKTIILEHLVKDSDGFFEVTDNAGQSHYCSIPQTPYYDEIKEKAYTSFLKSGETYDEVLPVFVDNTCSYASFSKLTNNNEILRVLHIENNNHIINHFIQSKNNQPGSQYVENTILKSNSTFTRKMGEQIESFSRTDLPILLTGEKNTGKKDIARILHNKSASGKSEFLEIDCEVVLDEDIHALFETKFGIDIVPDATLYLKHINCLSLANQKIITKFLSRTKNHKRYRIISSTFEDLEEMIQEKHFLDKLYRYISELKIKVPPLREYKQDIESISIFLISNFNVKYGRELVGLEKKSLEVLTDYDWPGNIYQFESVMMRIMLRCNKAFIPANLVKEVLDDEAMATKNVNSGMHETLAQIERRIIQQVLEDENMNQSTAAKRLGIGRSTLWRKLNMT